MLTAVHTPWMAFRSRRGPAPRRSALGNGAGAKAVTPRTASRATTTRRTGGISSALFLQGQNPLVVRRLLEAGRPQGAAEDVDDLDHVAPAADDALAGGALLAGDRAVVEVQ